MQFLIDLLKKVLDIFILNCVHYKVNIKIVIEG